MTLLPHRPAPKQRKRRMPLALRQMVDFVCSFPGPIFVTVTTVAVTLLLVFVVGPALLDKWAKEHDEMTRVLASSKEVWSAESSVGLASMANGTKLSGFGALFVVYGSEDDVIRYTEKTVDGGYKLRQMRAGDATVFEIDGESKDPLRRIQDPRLEEQRCVVTAANEKDQEFLRDKGEEDCGARTVMYVPAGSVSTEFDLNPGRAG